MHLAICQFHSLKQKTPCNIGQNEQAKKKGQRNSNERKKNEYEKDVELGKLILNPLEHAHADTRRLKSQMQDQFY